MTTTLPDHWIDLAAAHGSTKWLKQFIRSYLPPLREGAIASREFEQALVEELEARRLVSAAQQKNYRSNVVQALKVIDEQHPAIALVGLSTEQYRELNDEQRGRLAERQTQFLGAEQVEKLVARATGLLESSEWSEVGAGLAVLVGRRISEILLSEFELKTAWSLKFTGVAKKGPGKGDRITIEIPTLAPAETVLRAIGRLQQALKIEDLRVGSVSPKLAKQRVNDRYSAAIAVRCEEQFADLVPPRSDRETLYTHLFRAVYATIAAHWFCPPTVPEHLFKAEIQGHFTMSRAGRKLPNYAARSNYDDYQMGDGRGNRDGRLGVKLGTLPGLTLLEVFQKGGQAIAADEREPELERREIEQGDTKGGDRASGEDQAQKHRGDRLGPAASAAESGAGEAGEGKGREGDRAAVGAKVGALVIERSAANTIRYRAASLLGMARASAAERAVALQILTGLSLTQLMHSQLRATAPLTLEVDGGHLQTLVQQLLPQIEKLRRSPLPAQQEMQQVCEETFAGLPVQADQLQQVYGAIVGKSRQDAHPMTTSKPKSRRPELHADDLDQMHRLMAKFGIGGNSAEVFHALLSAFEQAQVQQQQQQQQTLAEVAQTLNWFTAQLDRLKEQLQALQTERDQLNDQVTVSDQVQRLQAENHRLKTELHATQARLEAIQKLLGGLGDGLQGAIAPALNPAPAIATPVEDLGAAQIAAGKVEPASAAQKGRSQATITPRKAREDTIAKIHQIIDAIIAWNTSQDDSQRQLRISIPIIKAIATPLAANYQPAIQQVVQQREHELDGHHSQLMLGVRHNASVVGKDQILQQIQQQYLGAEM